MHEQIRIAPDRRGEMRVRRQRETEMARIARLIDGETLRAQQHRFDQTRIGPLAHFLQKRREIRRLHLLQRRQLQMEFLEELQEILVLRRRRRRMHAIRRRNLALVQELRRLHVCRDHAFLDQLVRIVAMVRAELHDFAGRRQPKFHLGAFEIDRTALLARLGEHLVQLMQMLQLRHDIGELFARLGVLFADRLPHALVGEARVRAHDRRIEFRARDFAVAIDLHIADHAQALHFRIQRADAVRKRLRQHRHDESREIDRRRAIVAFGVERGAGSHVVRHIGDRDDQAESVRARFGIDRIVEIARVRAVDRDQRNVAKIDTLGDLGRQNFRRDVGGFAQRRGRPFVRQAVARDRHLDHERRRQPLAEHR